MDVEGYEVWVFCGVVCLIGECWLCMVIICYYYVVDLLEIVVVIDEIVLGVWLWLWYYLMFFYDIILYVDWLEYFV